MNSFSLGSCKFVLTETAYQFKHVKKYVPEKEFYIIIDNKTLFENFRGSLKSGFSYHTVTKILKSKKRKKPIIAGDETNSLVLETSEVQFFFRKEIVFYSLDIKEIEEKLETLNTFV